MGGVITKGTMYIGYPRWINDWKNKRKYKRAHWWRS
jgi:hypothetical protein